MAAKEKTGGAAALQLTDKQKRRKATLKLMRQNYQLYIFLIPAIVFIVLFMYTPLYGLQIAFKNYRGGDGIWGSAWVGLKWFNQFFSTPRCWEIVKNTLTISVYSLIAGFPLPICLAIILNYVKNLRFKKFAQTVTYMPYFISTVVLVAMMNLFFSPSSGFVNTIIKAFGGEAVYFMGMSSLFPHMYVWSGIWQSMGYSSIIYIAALSGVSPELHESAVIDGANILQRIWHIDIPTIMPTMIILLIMSCGNIMNVGYEKVYLMQNDLIADVSEIISTYVYKIGLTNNQFSFSTAIGLMNNVINFVILVAANKLANKLFGSGLW
ncbi:MAG: sugar ABC transporter permease [Acutalibacter sp.]|jgi:putative aldouronate transport system permease protein|uniref:ABC transporter permease n=1 Tax=Acutalibacter sp. TaxID=1918636 RepID=UPI00137308BB|nr:ABC transporter permease subunit [Acutalibacter sp.]MCI9226136.1 sugar ABC transporter permease [Acutalibacter sp.]